MEERELSLSSLPYMVVIVDVDLVLVRIVEEIKVARN